MTFTYYKNQRNLNTIAENQLENNNNPQMTEEEIEKFRKLDIQRKQISQQMKQNIEDMIKLQKGFKKLTEGFIDVLKM